MSGFAGDGLMTLVYFAAHGMQTPEVLAESNMWQAADAQPLARQASSKSLAGSKSKIEKG